MRRGLGLAVTLFLCLLATPALADSCDDQIPTSLKEDLGRTRPYFRTPEVADNSRPDVEADLRQGGNGCLGVAVADFDGDGTEDVLMRQPAVVGQGAMIVVALARKRGWWIEGLTARDSGRSQLYVRAGPPGVYRRAKSLDGPFTEGEVDSFDCPHAVAIFGTIESSAVAYCYIERQRWQHVWLSD